MNRTASLAGLCLTATLLLASCGQQAAAPAPTTGTNPTQPVTTGTLAHATPLQTEWRTPDLATVAAPTPSAKPHDIIVTYRPEAQAALDALIKDLALEAGAPIAPAKANWRAMSLRIPGSLSADAVQAKLKSSGQVLAIENDPTLARPQIPTLDTQALKPQATPPAPLSNDPLLPQQWWLRAVHADEITGVTGKGVTVAVVDEDVNRLHEDLKADGKIVKGYRPGFAAMFDQEIAVDEPLFEPTAEHGSGSAGTIAERMNNGVGGRGVAPDATIMPIDIFSLGGSASAAARGIVWAVDHGARVINNSWGGLGYVGVLKEAVDYALARGVVVVGSAGNDYSSLHNGLAAFPGVISVGASTGLDTPTDFSNTGDRVDLFAPGDAGVTTYSSSDTGYGFFGGTSMAGPVVSGAAALLLERADQLGVTLTPYQVKHLLVASADRPASMGGQPRLNVQAALALLERNPHPALGGHVAVQVAQVITLAPLSGMDVTLVPLDGQNKGMNYVAQTGRVQTLGTADFYDIDPGRYRVQISNRPFGLTDGTGGSRVVTTSTVTVTAGGTQAIQVQAPQDTYEYYGFFFFNDHVGFRNDVPTLSTGFNEWVDGAALVAVLDHSDYGPWEYQFAPPPPDLNTKDTDCYSSDVAPGMQWSAEAFDRDYGSNAHVKLTAQVGDQVIQGFSDYITKRQKVFYANTTDSAVRLTICATNDVAAGGTDGANSFYALQFGYKPLP